MVLIFLAWVLIYAPINKTNDRRNAKNGLYLLSNINPYTHEKVKKSNLFELVDGYILSYEVHKIKPYEGIYYELKNNYNLEFEECLFIDDNINNIQTATKLGIKPGKVNPDDYDSIVEILKKYNIKGI